MAAVVNRFLFVVVLETILKLKTMSLQALGEGLVDVYNFSFLVAEAVRHCQHPEVLELCWGGECNTLQVPGSKLRNLLG